MADFELPSDLAGMSAFLDGLVAENEALRVVSRDGILARMGYADYHEYLSKPLWRRIRKRVIVRDEAKCFRCGGKATEVHHDAYTEAVLRGEDDSALFSLCGGCHGFVEFDDDGVARLQDAKCAVLREADLRRDFPEPQVDLRLTYPKLPDAWDRMNYWQRGGWSARYAALRNGKKDMRAKVRRSSSMPSTGSVSGKPTGEK